jgi:hypothetical protein
LHPLEGEQGHPAPLTLDVGPGSWGQDETGGLGVDSDVRPRVVRIRIRGGARA